MRRFSAFFFAGAILISLCGCGSGSGVGALSTTFTSTPGTVPGGTNFVFSVTTQNDTLNRGVTFTLALNEPSNGDTTTPCTTACGALSGQTNTITANGPDIFTSTTTVNFAAPLLPPTPNSLILTATSVANSSVTVTDTFEIGAPQVVVHITNKITNISPGSEPVTLNAQVLFDATDAGVTWMLAAQGAACSPACGTLTSAQPFNVIYTPPATLPAAPNNTPTITATSVNTTTVSDFDDIRIQASTQPISVSITNPFAQINAGSSGSTINAMVENDVAGQGVTWSLEPSAQTGALSAQQPGSVIYTPPNTAPQPPNNMPTITATSVADPTKSDSFTFTIAPAAAFQGAYAFIIRGHDESGNTIAAAGSLTSDGAGKISTGEVDINANNLSAAATTTRLTGVYETESSNVDTQSIRVMLDNFTLPNQSSGTAFTISFADAATGSRVVLPVGSIVTRAELSTPSSTPPSIQGTISGRSGLWNLTGEISRQELASAVITSFTGKEFWLTLGPETTSRVYELGSFSLADDGTILPALLNLGRNSSGRGSSEVRSPDEFVASRIEIDGGNLAAFDANGRASLTIVIADFGTALHFAAYAVSATRILLVETDPPDSSRPPKSGVAQLQVAAR
jgi:hypothetical protein